MTVKSFLKTLLYHIVVSVRDFNWNLKLFILNFPQWIRDEDKFKRILRSMKMRHRVPTD